VVNPVPDTRTRQQQNRRYGGALLLAGHCFEGVQLPVRKVIVLFKAPRPTDMNTLPVPTSSQTPTPSWSSSGRLPSIVIWRQLAECLIRFVRERDLFGRLA
jgi:hypothetical protein